MVQDLDGKTAYHVGSSIKDAGKKCFAISLMKDSGDVYACRRVSESKVGNVFEDRLADVWVCRMENYREYEKFSKCSKCELKPWCRGCPAVAKGTNGDFYADNPQCWKIRNDITGEVL